MLGGPGHMGAPPPAYNSALRTGTNRLPASLRQFYTPPTPYEGNEGDKVYEAAQKARLRAAEQPRVMLFIVAWCTPLLCAQ